MLTYYTRKEWRVQMIGRDEACSPWRGRPAFVTMTYDSSLATIDVAAQMIDELAEFFPNVRGMRPRIF